MPRQVRAIKPDMQRSAEDEFPRDRRALLVALRDRLFAAIHDPKAPPASLPPLTKRLLETVDEIERIDAEGGKDDVGRAAAVRDEKWTAS